MDTTVILTKRTYVPHEGLHTRDAGPSLTVPDETMSLREIKDRFARGQSVKGNLREPLYEGDREAIDIEDLDLADREDYILDKVAELKSIKDQQLKAEAAKKLQLEKKLATDLAELEELRKATKLSKGDGITQP